jgi:GxxExxY protein
MSPRRSRRIEFDGLSNPVFGCAVEVHREPGPGLLESSYEQCLAHELKLDGITFRLQPPQPAEYKRVRLKFVYRADVLAENALIHC